MAKTKKQTKAPTAKSITRNGNKFTLTWKITCENCEEQQVRYRYAELASNASSSLKDGGWEVITIGKAKTSYTVTMPAVSYFYPETKKNFKYIQMSVRCRRSDSTNYNFTYSDWVTLKFSMETPPKPSLSVTNNSYNSSTFTWSRDSSATDKYHITNCAYRSWLSTGSAGSWTSASLSSSKTYSGDPDNTTRYFEVKTQSIYGDSDTVKKSHYIGTAPAATVVEKNVTYMEYADYYAISFKFTVSGGSTKIDSITPQWVITEPESDMSCPSGASWNGDITLTAKSGVTEYSCTLNTTAKVSTDQCLWIRVLTTHDSQDTASETYCLKRGYLSDPTVTVSSVTVTDDNITATMTAEWDSIDGAYGVCYLVKGSNPSSLYQVGEITTSGGSLSVDYDTDMSNETEYALGVKLVSAGGEMTSENIVYYSGITPKAPDNVTVASTATSGKVYITWDSTTWSAATGSQLSWSTEPDAWMSTEEPDTFEINDADIMEWYISGLDTGVTYYFKVRLLQTSDDVTIYSPWSDMVSLDLSSAPDTPVITLSSDVANYGDTVTAYWAYVTTDGTSQFAAEVVEATYSDGWTYSSFSPQITAGSEQYVDIDTEAQGWTVGTSRYLALKVISYSGNISEYSEPVLLTIAPEATCSITSTSLSSTDTITELFDADGSTTFSVAHDITSITSVTIDDVETTDYTYAGDEVTFTTAPDGEVSITYTAEVTTLTEMPLTVTTSTTEGGTLSLVIERAQSCPMERPNGEVSTNPEGETIALINVDSDSTNTTDIDALIGSLDDGALYTLTATITDAYGQTASDSIDFTVHWAHQAIVPSGYVGISSSKLAALITINDVDGSADGDSVDVYRLSLDKPELIYSGASFGDTIVDPYPALGKNGGHRLVYVTSNGDYTTEDGVAWLDLTSAQGDGLDIDSLVIDWENERVTLPYNISLSNKWDKDFERTRYLGGSVVGDWNRGVMRDLSAGAEVVRLEDTETIRLMRELARYAGICHVRTPDGSSFAADVQVTEQQSYDSMAATFTLTIQKIDNEGADGILYEDWE